MVLRVCKNGHRNIRPVQLGSCMIDVSLETFCNRATLPCNAQSATPLYDAINFSKFVGLARRPYRVCIWSNGRNVISSAPANAISMSGVAIVPWQVDNVQGNRWRQGGWRGRWGRQKRRRGRRRKPERLPPKLVWRMGSEGVANAEAMVLRVCKNGHRNIVLARVIDVSLETFCNCAMLPRKAQSAIPYHEALFLRNFVGLARRP